MKFSRIHEDVHKRLFLKFYELVRAISIFSSDISTLVYLTRHDEAIRQIHEARGIKTLSDTSEAKMNKVIADQEMIQTLYKEWEALIENIDFEDISPIDLRLMDGRARNVDKSTDSIEKAYIRALRSKDDMYDELAVIHCRDYFEFLHKFRQSIIDHNMFVNIYVPRFSKFEDEIIFHSKK